MAETLAIPLEMVQEKTHKFLTIVYSSIPGRLTMLINEILLKTAKDL